MGIFSNLVSGFLANENDYYQLGFQQALNGEPRDMVIGRNIDAEGKHDGLTGSFIDRSAKQGKAYHQGYEDGLRQRMSRS